MPLNTKLSLMDEDKLKKLEEQLYNDTPFFGDRIRQNAAKELIEEKNSSNRRIINQSFYFQSG